MGVLFGYYAAGDDEHARRAVERDDDEVIGTGYDEVVVKGIDPVLYLLPAEVLVTGRPQDAVEADPRRTRLIGMVGDGEVVAVSLTDAFRDSLAGLGGGTADEIACDWSVSEVFGTPPDVDALADFLDDLAALARRAVAREQRLYCWICP